MFENHTVNLPILKQRAYNLRWATVPEGVIPLTAADPDFPSAPAIAQALVKATQDRYLCYGPPSGLPIFKESVARFLMKKGKYRQFPNCCFRLIVLHLAFM